MQRQLRQLGVAHDVRRASEWVSGLALGPGAAEVGGGGVGGGVHRRAVEGLAVLVDVAEVVAPVVE